MFSGSRFSGACPAKMKNVHSLENMKHLYQVLSKNDTVTEKNRILLVETLRSMTEILIWGDQNDSSVFDFFLEKNILGFFLNYMRQKNGQYICIQLLQTLNILFENINSETSVYYLLSNNHINSIICHKFDFSDEEVMAYYISFLKTLSFKLNKHTINFFYNEHTNDFALYSEAIKFFNNSESMVRIAVRTITLNVYKVDDKAMLRYIRDKTAVPYFSNLVYFIGTHILDLDRCVRNDLNHNNKDRLELLVAEHLDHLHYLNDILLLGIESLNDVFVEELMNHLFVPLYVYSLTKTEEYSTIIDTKPHISALVSLFLMSQVFVCIRYPKIMTQLADILFNQTLSICFQSSTTVSDFNMEMFGKSNSSIIFKQPTQPLSETLSCTGGMPRPTVQVDVEYVSSQSRSRNASKSKQSHNEEDHDYSTGHTSRSESVSSQNVLSSAFSPLSIEDNTAFSLDNRHFLSAIFNALVLDEIGDSKILFATTLIYAISTNLGIESQFLESVFITSKSEKKHNYNYKLVDLLVEIILNAPKEKSKIRLITLEVAISLLKLLVDTGTVCYIQDSHMAAIEGAREDGTLLLRKYFKSDEIFIDMFEDEYYKLYKAPLNIEHLLMDSSTLLSTTVSPLTGIEFGKRLPCGLVETTKWAIRVFLLLRDLSLTLRKEGETLLPLVRTAPILLGTKLDLNNSDLLACHVKHKDKVDKCFLVYASESLILVEPDNKKLGWGIATFVGLLQDVEIEPSKHDRKSLNITVHHPASSNRNPQYQSAPMLSAIFTFDDHIRCRAARQTLVKKKLDVHERKIQAIAAILDMPRNVVQSLSNERSSENTQSDESRVTLDPNPQSIEMQLQTLTSSTVNDGASCSGSK